MALVASDIGLMPTRLGKRSAGAGRQIGAEVDVQVRILRALGWVVELGRDGVEDAHFEASEQG